MVKRINLHSSLAGDKYKPNQTAQSHKYVQKTSKMDFVLLGTVLILSLFGLLMVYDVSQVQAFQNLGDKYYFIKQQIVWALLGYVALLFFSMLDYHILEKIALPAFVISVILLLLVFVPGLGVISGGAHRWLRLGINIQPAEIIKLSSVIFLAALFKKGPRTLPFILILGLVGTIIGVFQRDLGSAIVYSIIALGIYFVADAPLVYFLGMIVISIIGFLGFTLSSQYRRHRVLAFLDPFSDPQGYSYHISQVLIALGSGGLFGLGIGQSRQKYAYIPEVTTDSIFSVVGEELGFVGSVFLIALIGFLIFRGIKIVQSAPDQFGKLLGAGLIIWLGAQAVVNLAAMVSLVPLTGVPLPFISYGGSALLANLVAVGILLNISKQKLE
ncbi:putative lipid II flippase FtsW [Patescibacteria group bacterium]|nr:putative lipid II flippase FtsW [Patescibacteria group bacterium]MCL5410105.1 putative lipid II flippase FtsW [Patescibacteria group bacterium]